MNLTPQQEVRLGIADLPPKEKEEMVAELEQTLFELALSKLTDTLSQAQIDKLNDIIEKSDSLETVSEYLQVAHPEFAKSYEDAVEEFIQTAGDIADEDEL